jgi:hypothetical protein
MKSVLAAILFLLLLFHLLAPAVTNDDSSSETEAAGEYQASNEESKLAALRKATETICSVFKANFQPSHVTLHGAAQHNDVQSVCLLLRRPDIDVNLKSPECAVLLALCIYLCRVRCPPRRFVTRAPQVR